MGLLSNIFGISYLENKSASTVVTVPIRTEAEIESHLALDTTGGSSIAVSAVHACARVIAEGLALPPCYVHRVDQRGKTVMATHPLHRLLAHSPNSLQTSYEFREQIGWHLALNGNAHVLVIRSPRGEVIELLPMDPSSVQVQHDSTRPAARPRYWLYGCEVPARDIWHLKGPAWLNYEAMSTIVQARSAIGLAQATELFGTKLFQNGARPGGLLALEQGQTVTDVQIKQIIDAWNAQNTGVGNAHKTAFLPAAIKYSPISSNANDAQWIESRRYQTEEICRFFRVSPTKVFQSGGSQSYASVEQAHIAHDQDTDAHWHERFVQSANKHLLTDKERQEGLCISLDNRAALRGTSKERMEYYQLGITNGIFTRNEAREMEGFDRSSDPQADQLTPAANLFGPQKSPPA